MAARACKFRKDSGEPCRAPPLQDGDFCLWHSPEHAEEVAEARKLGGLRRRRERTVSGAYDFEGVETIGQIQRLLNIAVLDTLGLENSVARSRTLAYLAQVGLKVLEVADFADRIAALEAAVGPRLLRKR
ncbi:MAG: hypothetical protein Q7T33_04765 [Dehalococcoidia bacterium]|nr:hypothetical protein [Dehalococcoidia bacterium]